MMKTEMQVEGANRLVCVQLTCKADELDSIPMLVSHEVNACLRCFCHTFFGIPIVNLTGYAG